MKLELNIFYIDKEVKLENMNMTKENRNYERIIFRDEILLDIISDDITVFFIRGNIHPSIMAKDERSLMKT